MSVEIAVIMPVTVVVALAIANIMSFLGCCATFDRASLDAVIAHGVSPSGLQSELSATVAIQASIEEALGSNPSVSSRALYLHFAFQTMAAASAACRSLHGRPVRNRP